MKTLILTLEYPPQIGGIASYVYNLAKSLPPIDVVVYAPPALGDRNFDSANPWPTYRLKPYFNWFWPRWLRMLWQVYQIVKKEKIEQLYVQQVLPVGYVAYLLKKFKKIPYTIFLHGTDIEYAYRPLKRSKFKKICQAANAVVVNSLFLKTKLESRVDKLPPLTIVYPCPNNLFFGGVSAGEISQLKSRLALNGKKVILSVGRIAEGKGFPHIARLLLELIKIVPNLVWVVVGDGPKLPTLIQLIQKNNLQNIVRLVGSQPYLEMPKYYACADLFVLLSHPDNEAEEGWGTVFVEAAASGLPIVAGRAGGSEEAVVDKVTGRVVDVCQKNLVISAITSLLTDEATAKQMGQAGRARALTEFVWSKQIQKFF